LLDTISEVEMIIDEQRHALNANQLFAPYTAFARVDISNRERISAHDLLGYF
jgi:Ca2+-binding EF-hand superfamily protein